MAVETTETVKDMVRADDVAARFGVSVKTVQRALARREIPGLIIGTCYLVNAAWYAAVTSWPQEATS